MERPTSERPDGAGTAVVLVVDGANVVGSRPDGWWRDRAGAAARLHERLVSAGAGGLGVSSVVLVLEGRARAGVPEGEVAGGVRTVHAPADGDAAIAELAKGLVRGAEVVVVTADRALGERVRAVGADVRGPGWLLDRL